jgi:hypothetical protein
MYIALTLSVQSLLLCLVLVSPVVTCPGRMGGSMLTDTVFKFGDLVFSQSREKEILDSLIYQSEQGKGQGFCPCLPASVFLCLSAHLLSPSSE